MSDAAIELQPVDRSVEADQVQAIASLPRDLAIVKMDNDNMMALAAAHPRDYGAIQKDMEAQLKAFPEFAKMARYAKPVGREDKCPKCGAKSNYQETCPSCRAPIPMKIARGLSIRAAEALRLSFGFTKLDQTAEEIHGGEAVQLTTTLVDYQKGNVTRKSFPVSKSYKDRYGRQKRIADDRFYDLTVKAKASIQARDCVMTMVPPGMKAALEASAIKAQAQLLSDDVIKAMVRSFANKSITQEMLENVIGKPISAFTVDDRTTLLGLWTAIEDGEITVAEAFGVIPEDTPPKSQALAEKLKGKKTKPEPEPEPEPSEPEQSPPSEEPVPFENPEEPLLPKRVTLADIGSLEKGAQFVVECEISKIDKRTSKDGKKQWWDVTGFVGPLARAFSYWHSNLPDWLRIGARVQIHGQAQAPYQGQPQFSAIAFERV